MVFDSQQPVICAHLCVCNAQSSSIRPFVSGGAKFPWWLAEEATAEIKSTVRQAHVTGSVSLNQSSWNRIDFREFAKNDRIRKLRL